MIEIKNYFKYLVKEGIIKAEKDDKTKLKNPFKILKDMLITLKLLDKKGVINTLSIQNHLINSLDNDTYISFKIPKLAL